MSALIVRVCDRQTKGRGNGPVGCLRVIWCVWAGRVESMPCAPHTADCFSDQPHPSRAHSAGTPPSRAADVRGDLQRHAAGCRGPKGGVGMVVVVVVVAEAGWGGWSRVNGGENWQSADVSHFGAASYMRSAEFNAATQKWLLEVLVPRARAYTLNRFLNAACVRVCVWRVKADRYKTGTHALAIFYHFLLMPARSNSFHSVLFKSERRKPAQNQTRKQLHKLQSRREGRGAK